MHDIDFPAGAAAGGGPMAVAAQSRTGSDAQAPDVPASPPPAAAPPAGQKPEDAQHESTFPLPPSRFTQQDASAIEYDFNDGCRIHAPMGPDVWRIRMFDLDTGNLLFQTTPDFRGGTVLSAKKFYVRFRIEAWKEDKLVFAHDYDPTEREVLICFPVGTLGDTIAWLSYAVRFAGARPCRLTIAMAAHLIELFADAYPHINFISTKAVDTSRYYATYRVGLFFTDVERVNQPVDFRHVGLHRIAAFILGLETDEAPPRLGVPDEGRPIEEKYVVIATQATSQCKYWNNPYGWREVVKFLKEAGYRVICIDQKPVSGAGIVWNHIPAGAEDETGDRPLAERVHWLRHAEFFVGLSSGLAWLAWAAGTKVVMIGGFTLTNNEFATPYRVINYHACTGCWHDPALKFDHHDYLWCPRHAGTARQFECTSLITAAQVMRTIRTIPGFPAAPVPEGPGQTAPAKRDDRRRSEHPAAEPRHKPRKLETN